MLASTKFSCEFEVEHESDTGPARDSLRTESARSPRRSSTEDLSTKRYARITG